MITYGVQMATYERLLADTSVQRAEADEQPQQLGKPALTPAQQRMRYLKIGGAAVAGGALLAVTGAKHILAQATEGAGSALSHTLRRVYTCHGMRYLQATSDSHILGIACGGSPVGHHG